MNYYNEIDPHAANWLRVLISEGLIPNGEVDERDIRDIRPSELRGFVQCHFFAGIGGWAYAIELAGWPEDEPVWTGSCPCQPFSAAGKGAGFDDERHLWPDFFWLICNARPRTTPIFGEQVASKEGLAWIDLVQTDMEGSNHAFVAVDLCAPSVSAPHARQRLYWCAESAGNGRRQGGAVSIKQPSDTKRTPPLRQYRPANAESRGPLIWSGNPDGLGFGAIQSGSEGTQRQTQESGNDADGSTGRRSHSIGRQEFSSTEGRLQPEPSSNGHVDGDSDAENRSSNIGNGVESVGQPFGLESGAIRGIDDRANAEGNRILGLGDAPSIGLHRHDSWREPVWLPCRDFIGSYPAYRPTEPALLGLADGLSDLLGFSGNCLSPLIEKAEARTIRLKGYGNAIVPQLAAEFIKAFRECR